MVIEARGGRPMWIAFGAIAIIATLVNLFMYWKRKSYKLAMVIALAFTSLTVVAEYSLVADWVESEDWSALADVVPTVKMTLWFLTVTSILLNVTPMILEFLDKK